MTDITSTTFCGAEDCPGHRTTQNYPGKRAALTDNMAAPLALVDTITVSLKVENDYADGYSQTNEFPDVELDAPDPDVHEDDWASDSLFEYTGTGTGRENVDALYTVTITACAARPDLVGRTFEFGG